MNLVAMVVARNEVGRYLGPCVESLLGFCDNVRLLDDGSDDHPLDLFLNEPRVQILRNENSTFFEHEGATRQALLEWAMQGLPTHLLAIDADEFVADGETLRAAMEEGASTGVWKLTMTEVWKADEDFLWMRYDGDWRPRPIGIAFSVPVDHWTNRQSRRHWRLPDRALACGRVPVLTQQAANRTITDPVTDLFHFGWTCEADRDARYQRYVKHDGGQFHKNNHLESIMWTDEQVKLVREPWWPTLDKQTILARVNR